MDYFKTIAMTTPSAYALDRSALLGEMVSLAKIYHDCTLRPIFVCKLPQSLTIGVTDNGQMEILDITNELSIGAKVVDIELLSDLDLKKIFGFMLDETFSICGDKYIIQLLSKAYN